MEEYIEQIHREPFSLLHNNCLHKAIKIVRKARSLGMPANVVICISNPPKKLWGIVPFINPHAYALVKGVKVDVGLSPEQEQKYWKNSERKIYLPIVVGRGK